MARDIINAISDLITFVCISSVIFTIYDRNKLIVAVLLATNIKFFTGMIYHSLENPSLKLRTLQYYSEFMSILFMPFALALLYVSMLYPTVPYSFYSVPLILAYELAILEYNGYYDTDEYMNYFFVASMLSILVVSIIKKIMYGLLGAILMMISLILDDKEGLPEVLFFIVFTSSLYFLANGLLT